MSAGAKTHLLTPKRLALLDALRKDDAARKRPQHPPSIVPGPRARDLPLSFAELRLWFLYQLEPQSPVYNVSGNIWFSGQLDIEALKRSANEMARRHETLRTTFVEIDGVAKKVIAPEWKVDLPVLDLRHLHDDTVAAEVHRLATEEVLKPFDLARGPLLRITWVRVRDEENLILFTKHHIISDGWSVGGFLHEMATLYEAFSTGKPSPLPELTIQHSDFADWQRNWLQGAVLEEHLAFWRKQLEGAPALLDLPGDRPRPAVRSYRGGWKRYCLPLELSNAIKAFSRQEEVTLFMTLLAGFYALLHRYSGQTDIVVGTPMSNRRRVETEPLLGLIFNTLALRVSLAGDPSFRDLVHRVREVAVNDYAHQDLPFEQLVEALKPERSLSHSPIFQVMFVLQKSPMPEFKLPNVTMRKYDFHPQTAKFELTWTVDEKDPFVYQKEQQLTGSVEYSTDLFDPSTIDRMVDQYETLMAAAVAGPDVRISHLALLPSEERELLLHAWNATDRAYPGGACLSDLFRTQLERDPQAVALWYDDETLTFRDLHTRANQLAHYLQRRGIGPDSVVAVCLDRTPELIAAMLAVLQAGGAYLPLDPAYPPERLAFMLADSEAALLITRTSLLDRIPQHAAQTVCLDAESGHVADLPAGPPPSAARPDNLAYLIYTSGSTGRPKGVAITHRNAANMLAWARDAFPQEDRMGVLAATSVCFDLSIFELFLPLAYGGTVVLARNVLDLPRLPAARAVTLVNTVPSAMTELLRQEALPPNVRCVNLAGEGLPAELVQQLRARHPGVTIVNLYGPSETTTYSTAAAVDPASTAAPPIGRPVANTQIYVLDRRGQPAPIGVPGELYIGGAGVARGYLARPELTAERFVPDPFGSEPGARLYRTGDRARWRADGQLDYLGRNDHQVKLRGFRIELGEIEHVLGQHPGVREAVATTRVEAVDDVRLVAYVVPGDGAGAEVEDLRTFLKDRLPDYMVPNIIVPLEAVPRTPNGKVDRSALPDPLGRSGATPASAPPRTASERLLAGIWQSVLRVEQVSVDDSFFALGGHSLLAMRVVARVRQEARVELPVRAIFEAPRLAELAQVLDSLQARASAPHRPPIRAGQRRAAAPLSFTQQRLWFLNQLEHSSTAYTIPTALRLTGPLNTHALRGAVQSVMDRHEALRTTFSLEGREPMQQIHAPMPLAIPIMNLRGLAKDEQEAEVLRHAQAALRKPFDLAHGPLLRATLLALDDRDHVLLVMMHHAISDGWSIGIFLRDLIASYEALATGQAAGLPPLPIQYADFAIWQRQWIQGPALEMQLEYWRRQLAGAPTVLNLPTDRPRPAVERHRGARCSFPVSRELRDAVADLSRRHGVTLFMTLLSAWQALLSRYSGDTDVSVGSPIAGRTAGKTEELIGCFVNTLVLRTDLSGNPSFVELLQRVRQLTLDAYSHQDVPFGHLVEVLQPERSLSHSPLFQVMFILQNLPVADLKASALRIDPIDLPAETSKFDLTLALMEAAEGLRGTLEYNVDLFDRTTVERMTEDYRQVLEAIVSTPEVSLNALPIDVPVHTIAGVMQEAAAPSRERTRQQPRTSTERRLAELWTDLLRVDELGVYDDFFALGGHSLLAVQLLVRIRETFNATLDLRQVFEAPTVAELSALIENAGLRVATSPAVTHRAAWSPLIALNAGAPDAACFCIHPGGGQVFWYTALARELAADATVYGVEARGLDGAQPPHVRIESMASSYIDAIRTVQPDGPYRLVGWSLGGLVAYEMCQQFLLQGKEVGLLAMLDTVLLESTPDTIDESVFAVRFIQDLAKPYGRELPALPETARLTGEAQLEALIRHAQAAQVLPAEIGLDELRNPFTVFRANVRAMLVYHVAAYPGCIRYFQAEASPGRSAAWIPLASGGLETRIVPGNHYTMLRPPHVDVLAAELRALLRASRRTATGAT